MKRTLVHAFRVFSGLALLLGGLVAPASAPTVEAAGIGDSLAPQNGDAVQSQIGPVLHSTTAYAVYWKQVDLSGLGQTFYYEATRCYGPGCLHSYGTDGNYENRTGTFLQDVGGSPWYNILTQYWDQDSSEQQVPVFSELNLAGTWEDNSDYPNLGRGVPAASLQTTDIQAEIGKAIQQNGWQVGPGTMVFVYLPEEVQACDAGTCTDTATNGSECGFHDDMLYDNQHIAYAVIGSPGDTPGCEGSVTSPSNDLMVDSAINAEAHELAEAVTDPIAGTGWNDPSMSEGEIADKCASDFPGRGFVLADGGDMTINGHDYTVQALWSDLNGGCTLGRVAVPYLDPLNVQSLQVENGSPSIQITGHNFGSTSAVQWTGTPIPTSVISSQVLDASIPAGDLLTPGVAAITVNELNTTGGTSNTQLLYITGTGATVTASKTTVLNSALTSLGTGNSPLILQATGGPGTVSLAQFNGNPAPGQTTGSANAYFNVYASLNSFDALTLTDCALNGGNQVQWYDPSTGWKPVSKQSYDASRRCVTLTVDNTTSPDLAQLQGTYMGSWSTASGYVVTNTDGALVPIGVGGPIGAPVALGHRPDALVLSPDGKTAYAANANDNTVDQISLGTSTVTQTFKVGKNPFALAISPNGQTVYAANVLDGTVSAIDVGKNTVTSIPVGTKPEALAISPDGSTLYVANRGSNTLSAIATASNQVTAASIPAGTEPDFVAITADGTRAYVADAGSDQVLPISLARGTSGTPLAVGKSPWGIAITPDGTKLFVANFYDNTVTPITLTGSSPSAGTPIAVGGDPSLIAITPDGSLAEVADASSGAVTPINVATNAAEPAFTVGSGSGSSPDAIAFVATVNTQSAPAAARARPAPAPTLTVNDTDPGVKYSGSGWGYYAGRPAAFGDLDSDVHATTNNGDSVSYTFNGTGIAYVSEKSDGYGTVQVSLDGAVQTVVDANAPGIHNQGDQTLYAVGGLSSGQHTLTLEKTGGAYMLLDKLVIQTTTVAHPAPNVQLTNDTDPSISYNGAGWQYYNGRPSSFYDIDNDIHATTANGDSASFTFTGTGVSYISEKSDGYGQVGVYLDGVLQTTVDANATGVHNAGGQVLYSTSGLSAGKHTIKLVKQSGVYMLLDAFIVQP